ncbi:nucleotide exchange factor GrpE [Thermotalea metallivorans]|uniref:Protein GrpE n=1 Tax=Thermotalea metallivorans TaxID=520762 RepID=A0A140L6Y8_9FIRM|nr:nucleotide exchange factor GrpE [Thermotalea metallivorans]KXG76313.1 hypothetical protein AN619_12710 [Thermotalea metallivorans]
MDWKFWFQRKKTAVEEKIEELQMQIAEIDKKNDGVRDCLDKILEGTRRVDENLWEHGEAISKLSRLQYKTTQELQRKLDLLDETVRGMEERQRQQEEALHRQRIWEAQRKNVTDFCIRWVDDMDALCAKISENSQDSWYQLLRNWQEQLLLCLETMGIKEIPVLGTSFHPHLCEALDRVAADGDKAYVPYEVVDVIRRGFVFYDGTILRKAQVITIKEEEKEE